NFAADRQAQTRAAIFAARRTVRLLERLEDDLLFVRRNADAGVRDRNRNDRARLVERLAIRAPAFGDLRDAQRHAALFGELERVRQQVADDLLQPLRVREHVARQVVVEFDV